MAASVAHPGPETASQQATVYDLSTAPQISPRRGLVIQLLCGAGILVLAGLVVAQLVLAAFRGTLDSISEGGAILIGIAIASVGLLALIVLTNSAGASKLIWNPEGFSLVFRGGKERRIRWNDPGLRIELAEVIYKGRTEYDLTGGMASHNYLTSEVYFAILAEAERRGLRVNSSFSQSIEISVRAFKIRSVDGTGH